jgi:hypothetical protein
MYEVSPKMENLQSQYMEIVRWRFYHDAPSGWNGVAIVIQTYLDFNCGLRKG